MALLCGKDNIFPIWPVILAVALTILIVGKGAFWEALFFSTIFKGGYMYKKKLNLPKMGTKGVHRRKGKKTLTQKERYAKRKKAIEQWKGWFK